MGQAKFDPANARQYPQTVARKSAIRLRPGIVRGPRRPAARPPPTDPRTIAVVKRERPDGWESPERDTTRRTPWPRASGPSSRITGAVPACMASACGCGPARDVRSCPTGAVRAAARYLPDRNVRFFGGASRTQPYEPVDVVRRDREARDARGAVGCHHARSPRVRRRW